MSIQSGSQKFYSQIRRKGGGTIDQIDAPVAVSQTINKGDWLKLSSGKVAQAITKGGAGSITLAAASPGLYAVALGGITTDANGIATDGTGRTTLPVALLNDDTEIMLGLYSATPANSTQGTAGTNVGASFDLGIFVSSAAGNPWTYVMSVTTTAACLTLVEKSIESSSNEQYGFVWVKPLAAARVGA